jgi:hypothetical protein
LGFSDDFLFRGDVDAFGDVGGTGSFVSNKSDGVRISVDDSVIGSDGIGLRFKKKQSVRALKSLYFNTIGTI